MDIFRNGALLLLCSLFAIGLLYGADERKFGHGEPLVYPTDALQKGISGQVVVKISIDEKGNVAPTLITGFDGLNDAAVANASTWKFARGKPTEVTAYFYFRIVPQNEKEFDDFRNVGGLTYIVARHMPGK
jgi:TonB family protein